MCLSKRGCCSFINAECQSLLLHSGLARVKTLFPVVIINLSTTLEHTLRLTAHVTAHDGLFGAMEGMSEVSEKLDFQACCPLNVLVVRGRLRSPVTCLCIPQLPLLTEGASPATSGALTQPQIGWWRCEKRRVGSRVLADMAPTLKGQITVFSYLFYSVTSMYRLACCSVYRLDAVCVDLFTFNDRRSCLIVFVRVFPYVSSMLRSVMAGSDGSPTWLSHIPTLPAA